MRRLYIKDKDGNYVPTPIIRGDDGREISLRATDTHIQWKYDDTEWTNLVALSELRGKPGKNGTDGKNGIDGKNGTDGREVSMRVVSDSLQWRLGSTGTWQTLMSLATATTGASFGGMVVGKTLVLAEVGNGG